MIKKGELEHIRVEPTENGGAVTHVHKKMSSGRGKNAGPWLQDDRIEHYSHKTHEEAGRHVTAVLKAHHGASKNSEQGAKFESPGPKAGKKENAEQGESAEYGAAEQ
jgi:hypothetical protein